MASFRNGNSMGETAVTEEVSAAGENMNSVKKKEKDSIRLVRAVLSDAEELYELQKACFQALLEKYQDYELNPAAEPLEKTIGRLRENFTDFYFIMLGNRKIGGVRIRHRDRECKLGPIFLLTEYQGFGYAQETICQAEGKYPESVLWKLETILQEPKLCHLYEKMGYRRTGKTERVKDGMDLVYYEKEV